MIDITLSGPVATISAAGYDPLTRADIAFGIALRDAIRDAADEDSVKAIVLRASGTDFAAPADDAGLAAAAHIRASQQPQWQRHFAGSFGLYQTIAYCKKFVLTEVTGRCEGAGSMLVLCSDITVCDEGSTFGAPFTAVPESNLVLAALTMRLNRAKSWMLSPRPWPARRAHEAGLVNAVVAPANLRGHIEQAAQRATAMPLDGIAMTRILFESFLDTQGVGQEFDMAALYAASVPTGSQGGRP